MERSGLLLFCAISILGLSSPTARAQSALSCVPGRKSVPLEERVDASEMLGLFVDAAPPTCPADFPFLLSSCATQFNIEEGCCDIDCSKVFAQVEPDCLKEYGAQLCSTPRGERIGRGLLRAANRCTNTEEELSCESLTGSSGKNSTVEEPMPAPAPPPSASPVPASSVDCEDLATPADQLECILNSTTSSG